MKIKYKILVSIMCITSPSVFATDDNDYFFFTRGALFDRDGPESGDSILWGSEIGSKDIVSPLQPLVGLTSIAVGIAWVTPTVVITMPLDLTIMPVQFYRNRQEMKAEQIRINECVENMKDAISGASQGKDAQSKYENCRKVLGDSKVFKIIRTQIKDHYAEIKAKMEKDKVTDQQIKHVNNLLLKSAGELTPPETAELLALSKYFLIEEDNRLDKVKTNYVDENTFSTDVKKNGH